MSSIIQVHLLGGILKQELDNVRQLRAVLEQERQVLAARDAAGLKILLPQKAQLLGQLEQLDHQRQQWLNEASWPNDARLANHLRAYGPEFLPLWEELRSTLQTVKALNESNQVIAERSRRAGQELLDILRGKPKTPTTAGYGPAKGFVNRPGNTAGYQIASA